MKKTKAFFGAVLVLAVMISSVCYAATSPVAKKDKAKEVAPEGTVVIANSSGHPVYIYDWDMSLSPPQSVSPLQGADPLQNGQTVMLAMKTAANPNVAGRRIYVSAALLSNSLSKSPGASEPDAFNPSVDGDKMYSFAEYLYEPSNSRYTIDISYVDEFSYPLTLTFNVPTGVSYAGCQNGFEYGFKSLAAAARALNSRSDYKWSGLVWPTNSPSCPAGSLWASGIYRIIGPDKVWAAQSGGELPPTVPSSYGPFVASLPYNGNQLFNNTSPALVNFSGWLSLITQPAATGYPIALHSVATPDSSGKYGFFTYCNDNKNGEFTWVPLAIGSTLTIYGYDQ